MADPGDESRRRAGTLKSPPAAVLPWLADPPREAERDAGERVILAAVITPFPQASFFWRDLGMRRALSCEKIGSPHDNAAKWRYL